MKRAQPAAKQSMEGVTDSHFYSVGISGFVFFESVAVDLQMLHTILPVLLSGPFEK